MTHLISHSHLKFSYVTILYWIASICHTCSSCICLCKTSSSCTPEPRKVSISMSTAALAKTVLEYLKARRRLVAVSTLSVVATVFLSVALSYHLAVTRIQAVSSFHQETVAETHRSTL